MFWYETKELHFNLQDVSPIVSLSVLSRIHKYYTERCHVGAGDKGTKIFPHNTRCQTQHPVATIYICASQYIENMEWQSVRMYIIFTQLALRHIHYLLKSSPFTIMFELCICLLGMTNWLLRKINNQIQNQWQLLTNCIPRMKKRVCT